MTASCSYYQGVLPTGQSQLLLRNPPKEGPSLLLVLTGWAPPAPSW